MAAKVIHPTRSSARASNGRAPATSTRASTRASSLLRPRSASVLSDEAPAEGDNLSALFKDMVPDSLQGTDKYLDVITWNIKWFNARDETRTRLIASILSELNADVFVFQEIEQGSMEPVAAALRSVGAGHYKTFYGTTGGDQRVTLMYDTRTVRASTNPEELFTDDPRVSGTSKHVFPRRPVHSMLTVRDDTSGSSEPFDFHLVGLHLKSQRPDKRGDDGTAQRREAARFLADWLRDDTQDEDIIVLGDFNAGASQPEFEPFRKLEQKGTAKFGAFNPKGEASHYFKSGKSSRLDYIMISTEAADAAHTKRSKVIRWNALLDKRADLRDTLEQIIDRASDHLPVVGRFYFHDQD